MPLWHLNPRLSLWIYWYGGSQLLIPQEVVSGQCRPISFRGKEVGCRNGNDSCHFAWSDMMTDMIQPFWAIAMLAWQSYTSGISWAGCSWSSLSTFITSWVPLLHPQLVTKRACPDLGTGPSLFLPCLNSLFPITVVGESFFDIDFIEFLNGPEDLSILFINFFKRISNNLHSLGSHLSQGRTTRSRG